MMGFADRWLRIRISCARHALAVGASVSLVASAAPSGHAGELTTTPPLAPAPPVQVDPNAPPPPPPPMAPVGTPGSVAPPPVAGSTQARLEQATVEDSGVGLHFVYLQPEFGLGYASLGSTVPSDYRSGGGLALGVGGGLELIAFEAGARLRTLTTSNFNLWTMGGEFFYQPGAGKLWPRIGATVGHAWANSWNKGLTGECIQSCDLLDVSGIDVGVRAGLQYYLTGTIEVGGDVGLDALFLKRRALNGSASLKEDQSATGVMATAFVHVGWHFP